MKKFVSSVLVAAAASLVAITGCTKNRPYVTTTNPSMTADVGKYKFIASAVTPATIDTQVFDTSTTLVITGYSSDRVSPYDKIELYIANFKGKTGVNSIVQGEAGARYSHGVSVGLATGGIVTVTEVNNTSVVGYFSFNTDDGIAVTNGKFTVPKP
jgi:hypothetical protein